MNEGNSPQTNVAAQVEPKKQPDSTPSTGLDAGQSPSQTQSQPAAEYEYMTGVKLFLVLVSVTLTVFLMMLDESIIVTVSPIYRNHCGISELCCWI